MPATAPLMLRVLAFDSDLVALSALRTFAKTLELELAVALSPAAALEMNLAGRYDVVLLADEGQEKTRTLCKRIRASSANKKLRIVLAAPENASAIDVREWGADALVAKPIALDDLRRAIAEPKPDPAALLEACRKALIGGTVVMVDDDAVTVKALKKIVLALFPEVEVETAFDAATGLSQAARHSPALIILDHMMPGMDGKEFLKALRSHPVGRDIPVLAHSALNLEPVYENENAVEFLRKPATVDGLQAAITRLWARVH